MKTLPDFRYSSDDAINRTINEIATVADRLPCIVIIHSLAENCVKYMSRWGLQEIDQTLEAVTQISTVEYHARYFNPEYAEHYVPKIWSLLQRNTDETISFFQQVRKSETSEWHWYTSSCKILMRDENNKPLLSLTIAIPLESDHFFAAKANRLLEENIFLRNNLQAFTSLSKREREVLAQLALGKTASEIADTLYISPATAETHRRNIRQKLRIKNNFEIAQYARAFDLI